MSSAPPPPPGSSNPHGLPAKPGGPLPTFKPAFQPAARPAAGRPGQHVYSQGAYAAAAPPTSYQASPTVTSTGYNPYSAYGASAGPSPSPGPATYGTGAYGAQQQSAFSGYPQQQPANAYAGYESYAAPVAAPQIQNPFPLPGQSSGAGKGANGYDPEYEAQIAQWNSAYAPKDEAALKEAAKKGPMGNANTIPLGQRDTGPALTSKELSAAVPVGSKAAAVVTGADGKQKTVIRSGGGKTWQDKSLLEWDPAHPRLFVGNLAGEVTDDSLHKAFSVYPSIVKARVIRDGRTTKSKGYGFVSFTSTDDFFQAAKEMNGKYIGSHPVIVKRSTTEIKVTAPPKKGGKYNKNKGHRDNRGGETTAVPNAGIKKEGKKKGGMKVLG
jgi:hypothetical protein